VSTGVPLSTTQKVQKNNRLRGSVPLYAFIVAEYKPNELMMCIKTFSDAVHL